eukprot:UN01305
MCISAKTTHFLKKLFLTDRKNFQVKNFFCSKYVFSTIFTFFSHIRLKKLISGKNFLTLGKTVSGR